MKSARNIFVDTSAWVALADRDDAHHKKASSIYPSVLSSHRSLVTSNFIIAETYIIIRRELGHQSALSFLENVRSSPRIVKRYSSQEVEADAEKLLLQYADQDFSYTDVVSFVIMEKEKIKKAFCFDKHFLTAGFESVP